MLLEHVAERRLLLVLDNFEQVVAAAPTIAELLRAGSGLKVVASSRAVLRISGETEFAVPGLPVPPDPTRLSETDRARLSADARRVDRAAVEGFEAVRLFVARGAAARPGFELTDANAATIARICARLDGLPLAIELAAARLKILAPDAILERLERQFEVLASVSRDVPERQRTLRGAIAWSYDLLDPPAGRLLDRLAVFMGGFELEMAERVAGSDDLGIDVLDGIGLLVDQSLIGRSDEAGEPRFRLLEAVRLYALERLTAAGETEAIRDRHARAYLDLAEAAEPNLAGDEQRDWLERLERENENLRAALIYATEQPDTEVSCEGHVASTIKNKCSLAADLSHWLKKRGLPLAELDEVKLKQFQACSSIERGDVSTGHQLLEFLRSLKVIPAALPLPIERTTLGGFIRDYERSLSSERGVGPHDGDWVSTHCAEISNRAFRGQGIAPSGSAAT